MITEIKFIDQVSTDASPSHPESAKSWRLVVKANVCGTTATFEDEFFGIDKKSNIFLSAAKKEMYRKMHDAATVIALSTKYHAT